jgi:hypothetical protein
MRPDGVERALAAPGTRKSPGRPRGQSPLLSPTAAELGDDFRRDHALRWGTLPAVASEPELQGRLDLLETYVANYIAQEVRLEAAVRRLDAFTRFLEIAALANAQVTNVSGLARGAAVARPTGQGLSFDKTPAGGHGLIRR